MKYINQIVGKIIPEGLCLFFGHFKKMITPPVGGKHKFKSVLYSDNREAIPTHSR